MFVWVTCSGVVIGTAEFEPALGVAAAALITTPGYAIAAAAAEDLSAQFRHTQYWSALDGDFAEAVARRWSGGRLALEDAIGQELGVNNIAVLGTRTLGLCVVADFRPDLARIEAFLRTVGPGGDDRTRPAA